MRFRVRDLTLSDLWFSQKKKDIGVPKWTAARYGGALSKFCSAGFVRTYPQ